MNRTIADILFSAIIGDAAGYTLNGMKKNHIHAVFRDLSGYINPEPGLKNNMHKWKKAGLYSSISQNILITAACTDNKNINLNEFINAIKNAPEIPGIEYGIFRDPGDAEKNFILHTKKNETWTNNFDHPCSRILPPVSALLLIKNEKNYLTSVLNYISLFTKNRSTIACSLFLIHFLNDIIQDRGQSILETANLSAEKTESIINSNQNIIFNSGINPDYILSEIISIRELLREFKNCSDIDNCEKAICSNAGKKYSYKITRAGVNLPETILPMAIVLSNSCSDPEKIFNMAMSEGGASSPLTSLSASITTAFHGLNIPENLLNNLINKKKIFAYIDQIGEDKNRDSIIPELYNTESGLTIKEYEEYKAKTKNLKITKSKNKNKGQREIESGLSKHIVESWTKIDKAKWKKERNKEKL